MVVWSHIFQRSAFWQEEEALKKYCFQSSDIWKGHFSWVGTLFKEITGENLKFSRVISFKSFPTREKCPFPMSEDWKRYFLSASSSCQKADLQKMCDQTTMVWNSFRFWGQFLPVLDKFDVLIQKELPAQILNKEACMLFAN